MSGLQDYIHSCQVHRQCHVTSHLSPAQRSLMTFEEDAMDAAYKSLEGTEKFCDTSKKFSDLFSSSSQTQKLTPHQRLYRKSIIADCLLFEAILVFIRQSLTSYVKGGYLIRKAWKMYEKIYTETEKLCSQPSPISKPGVSSPTDKHVGASLYDNRDSFQEEEGEEGREKGEKVREEGEGDELDIQETVAVLGDTFAMQLGFGVGGGASVEGDGEGEGEGKKVVENDSGSSKCSSLSNSPSEVTGSAELNDTTGEFYQRQTLYIHTCTCTCTVCSCDDLFKSHLR